MGKLFFPIKVSNNEDKKTYLWEQLEEKNNYLPFLVLELYRI
jgi:hypothetical protein